MPDRLPTIRIFISSPADVRPERLKAEQIIARLDREFAYRFHVEAVLWEREPLVAAHHFQDTENIPQPRGMNIVVVILWSRLGVSLPQDRFRGAISGGLVTGTEWEFEDALAGARESGVPDLLLYRKTAEPMSGLGDRSAVHQQLEQLDRVEAFIARWFRSADTQGFTAASHSFATTDEFEKQLYDHLHALLERRAGASAEGIAIRWHEAPFRGLLSFDYEHAPVFFGRTRARNELRELLARREAVGCAFVLVLGASGSGKSSLVKAGLLPDVMLPGMIGRVGLVRWSLLRPSDAPGDLLGALAAALLAGTALPELVDLHYPQHELAALLREAPARAAMPIRQGLGVAGERAHLADNAEARIVLIVDQLEELFTLDGIDPAEREAFVAVLEALARSGLAWVIATMRSDFYDRLELMPSLAHLAADDARYNLLLPDDAERGQIIRQPALEAGLRFEVDTHTGVSLDAVILQAAAKDRGALPLLSFLLDQLWQHRTAQGELTFAAYNDLGGLAGALGRRAEDVFAEQPEAVQRALARVLRALVTVGQGAQATVAAQPAPINVFPEGSAERRLIDAFLAPEARLLVGDEGDASGARVRIAHEALLTHWPRAGEHIAQDCNDLRIRAAVEQAEAEWRAGGIQRGYLLRDPLLTNAADLGRRWREELTAELRDFIARSIAATRAATRRRWTIAATVMLLLASLAAASVGALIVAEQQRNDALIAQSRFLARDSHAATASGDAILGELLALSALRAGRPFVLDAEGALEDGAANRFERLVLAGHEDTVWSAAFSPDGKRLVTASADKTTRVWDAETGTVLSVLRGHEGQVNSAAFSPDGKRLLTASDDKTARLWSADTGAALAVLEGHEGRVNSAAFSPDGKRVVTASDDKTARLWNADTGALITILRYDGMVASATFSPDGKRVLAASDDKTAVLWDADTGAVLATLRGHDGAVDSAEFSPDGKRILTTSDDMTARVWDADTHAVLAILRGHEGQVTSAVFSPDGKWVITGSYDGTARLWNADTDAAAIAVLRGHDGAVYSVAFSPDGKRIATASADRTTRLWDRAPAAALATLRGHDDAVHSAVFSPDGKRLVTASDDKTARVWDADTGITLTILRGHEGKVYSAAFSPDGKRVVTASADKTALVWDTATGTVLAALRGHEDEVLSAAFSPDGKRVVTGSADKTARVWDAETGAALAVLRGHEDQVNTAIFSPDGKRLITASDDKTARLWDADTGAALATLRGHQDAINDAAFSPDGKRLVTASDDKTARVWDADTDAVLFTLRGHAGAVESAEFSPDGKWIVTASVDKTARLWDAATGTALASLRGHEDRLRWATFSPAGRRVVATASDDSTVRLWQPPKQCQALIEAVRAPAPAGVPRQLSAAQRTEYFLRNRPPGLFMTLYAALRPGIAWMLPSDGNKCE